MTETLLRSEAEELLRKGHRWTVEYCAGGRLPSRAGVGMADFPDGVLRHVPTPAAARKLARGKMAKTYFYVRLDTDDGGRLLRFVEG